MCTAIQWMLTVHTSSDNLHCLPGYYSQFNLKCLECIAIIIMSFFAVFVLSHIGFQVGVVKEQANCGEEDRLRHCVTGC